MSRGTDSSGVRSEPSIGQITYIGRSASCREGSRTLVEEGNELMSIVSGSGWTEQPRQEFFTRICLLGVSLEMLTNQTPGEAVSGRMNFLWEMQGPEQGKRQPAWGAGGALTPSSSLSSVPLCSCSGCGIIRVQRNVSWDGSSCISPPLQGWATGIDCVCARSAWGCSAQVHSELQFLLQGCQWH